MSEADASSMSSSASSVGSLLSQGTSSKEDMPPIGTVVIQQEAQEEESKESECEAEEFVLSIVADRAEQARRDLGYPREEDRQVEGVASEASRHHGMETSDISQEKKHLECERDVASPKSTCGHGRSRGYDQELVSTSESMDHMGMPAEGCCGTKAKEVAIAETSALERSISRPGAIHVNNPLSSSELDMGMAEMDDLEDDEEICLQGVSAHLVLEDYSGAAHTADLTCSEQAEDSRPIVEGDNVIPDTTDEKPWFLYFSIGGICLLVLVILLLVLGLAGVFRPTEEGRFGPLRPSEYASPAPISKLDRIREAGLLKCAYNAFASSDFEETLCKVLAAAIMGDAAEVKFVNLPLMDQRFAAVANGDVDVLIRVITHTMERAIYEASTGSAFAFSTPYLYEGMKIAGDPFYVQCAENNLKHLDECSELKVCVNSGSTHYRALTKLLPERYIVPLNSMFTSEKVILSKVSEGVCNLVAEERAALAPSKIRQSGYEGDYSITERYFTKEPLSIVTSSEDPQFSDFVNAVLEGLLAAEQNNITQDMASTLPLTSLFGEPYQRMFQDALSVSGHFGEMYDSFLGQSMPRDSLNMINNGTTGLIFSHPFGRIDHGRNDKPLGPYMQRILDRAVLRCGVRTGRPGFAHEGEDGQLSGIDVDYCCAIAAALFQGDKTNVEFVKISSATAGFVLLADGSLDVVAGTSRTLENDVRESTTGLGFSFSQSYFYGIDGDSLSMATRQEDSDWSSFVYWIVSASFYAEENNITSALANPMPEVFVYGQGFHRMFRDSVLAVGSYSEIYERNLQHIIPRSGRNQLNAHPNLGPQHHPIPAFFQSS